MRGSERAFLAAMIIGAALFAGSDAYLGVVGLVILLTASVGFVWKKPGEP